MRRDEITVSLICASGRYGAFNTLRLTLTLGARRLPRTLPERETLSPDATTAAAFLISTEQTRTEARSEMAR